MTAITVCHWCLCYKPALEISLEICTAVDKTEFQQLLYFVIVNYVKKMHGLGFELRQAIITRNDESSSHHSDWCMCARLIGGKNNCISLQWNTIFLVDPTLLLHPFLPRITWEVFLRIPLPDHLNQALCPNLQHTEWETSLLLLTQLKIKCRQFGNSYYPIPNFKLCLMKMLYTRASGIDRLALIMLSMVWQAKCIWAFMSE